MALRKRLRGLLRKTNKGNRQASYERKPERRVLAEDRRFCRDKINSSTNALPNSWMIVQILVRRQAN
jgi:hypothetical protein